MKLSEIPAIRWGGRAARYKDFPRAVVRAYDPYSLSPLTFQHDLEMGLVTRSKRRSSLRNGSVDYLNAVVVYCRPQVWCLKVRFFEADPISHQARGTQPC